MKDLIFELGIIYGGSALLATLFLFLKQPVVLAYIVAGIILGPAGFGFIEDPQSIEKFSHFGIILLMFLVGINLDIKDLFHLLKKTSLITVTASVGIFLATFIVFILFNIPLFESLIASVALMFSSSVITLKLIPTTDLHNKRIGELMVSILLFGDILAIFVILLLSGQGESFLNVVPILIGKTVLLFVSCYFTVKYFVFNLFRKFDVIQEYIFIFTIAWCLVLAELGAVIGLSHEIGAFIGGTSLAISPIAMIIAEKLKPLREFFLILFFFAIGAQFHPESLRLIAIPGTIAAVIIVFFKPQLFHFGFSKFGEKQDSAREMGIRLGQASEFSLLVGSAALMEMKISKNTFMLIEFTVILTFLLSTYIVMKKYATPISTDASHRRD